VCEVCAPFTKEINRATSVLGYSPDFLVIDPHDLDDILISVMDIAERVDRVKEYDKQFKELFPGLEEADCFIRKPIALKALTEKVKSRLQ
jgi:hypothetical protein